MQGAPRAAALVVADGARRHVRVPVPVEIAQRGCRISEKVPVCERGPVGSRGIDLGGPFHGAVRVHEQDVDRAPLAAARVVAPGAGGHVGHAVAVKVPQAGCRKAEVVVVRERRAVGSRGIDLGGPFHGAVRVHEQDVDRAPVAVSVVVAGRAGRDVPYAVAVQVADAGHRRAEGVVVCERRAVLRRRVDLGGPFHGAVRVHEQDVDRAPVGPARVVAPGAYRHVGHPVAVEVPDACGREPELVVVCKRGAVGRGRVYFGQFADGAVQFHEQDAYRAAVGPAPAVVGRPHREFGKTVAVQVPYVGGGPPELVARRGGQQRRCRVGGLFDRLCQPVAAPGYRVQADHVHVPRRAGVRGAGGHVLRPVAVDVPYAGGRRS